MDYVYERFKTPFGVKIETVTGGSRYSGKVWREIAMQIYCENGRNGYRDIGHLPSGAPFIYGSDERISISHTDGCLVVTTIPLTPERSVSDFAPSNAIGVDVERADREQAHKLRERFLNEEELKRVPDTPEASLTAWTCKEAMLKAGMNADINWRDDIVIEALPTVDREGRGFIRIAGEKHTLRLHTLSLPPFLLTVALS